MATWTRKTFDSVGVTEYPPGAELASLQWRFIGGRVILALDVSGSMSGSRLEQAVEGCKRFIDEAIDARYHVGLVLWHHGIEAFSPIDPSPHPAYALLAKAQAQGGTDIVPTLRYAHTALLVGGPADMVLAIFGDGDLGHPQRAETGAAPLIADNIRIITCGLGLESAHSLATIATEASADRIATVDSIADSVASMAHTLMRKQ